MASYKRILLKLSGESLMGDKEFGLDPKMLQQYANDINYCVHGRVRTYLKWSE